MQGFCIALSTTAARQRGLVWVVRACDHKGQGHLDHKGPDGERISVDELRHVHVRLFRRYGCITKMRSQRVTRICTSFLRELGMDNVGVLVPVINAHPHLSHVSIVMKGITIKSLTFRKVLN